MTFTLATTSLVAGEPPAGSSEDGLWRTVQETSLQGGAGARWIVPDAYAIFGLDHDAFGRLVERAPLEFSAAAASTPIVVSIPMPDGKYARYTLQESPIMEPALAAAYPEIKTYNGQGLDDPSATMRCDWTLAGFHAIAFTSAGTVYVDPYRHGDLLNYISYFRRDLRRKSEDMPHCTGVEEGPVFEAPGIDSEAHAGGSSSALASVGPTLRTYRLALAATGEYTAFHGGTVPGAFSAITTTVNRVTGIYERDLAIRLVLVAGESSIIYTDSATDPYTNTSPGTLLTQNQSNLDLVIGSANYDIGHVVGTGGGGLAALSVVCSGANKARGETGSPTPVGDGFDVDYVAHEMGHQFGAHHTFNGTSSNCGGSNRTASAAYEVGSGSTIMAYAGICGADDLQPHSDDYFHTKSFDEITSFMTSGGTCNTPTSTGNGAPTIDGGVNFTIPILTPFVLTAAGSDPNGDPLTYCWEEFDLGTAAPPNTDDGSRPIFRSFNPVTGPSRTFPQLSDILNTATFGESLPSTSRTMTFRVTARDNRASGGGSNYDFMTVTTSNVAGPFSVTAPNTAVNWIGNGTQTVTWSVAGTNAAPVNTANVKISLSTDGGNTFPTVLLASTPNDGSQTISVPNTPSTTARIKVEAIGNIFFDISNVNFTIVQDTGQPNMFLGTVNFMPTGGDGDAFLEPGEAGRLTIQVTNAGTVGATNVIGTLTTTSPGVSIVTTQPISYPDLAPSASGTNAIPFIFTLASSVPCGSTISFSLIVTYSGGGGPATLPVSISTGQPSSNTYSYTGPPVSVPDNSSVGVNIPITVSGFGGTLTDVDFRFDGSSCSSTIGSTTVGVTHSYVSDFVVNLKSPAALTVTLMNRPGGGTNAGVNFCQTLLNDGASNLIQSIATGGAPFSGAFKPSSALSVYNGQPANGTWTLSVADRAAVDTGEVRAFSLILGGIACNAPLSVPGTVPDNGPPLAVTKSGTTLTLAWGASCSSSGVDYAIYQGTIGSWYSHTAKFCTTKGLLTQSFAADPGSQYFLVVPLTGEREGSYGKTGGNAEITPGGTACKPQLLGGCP